jgi:hypothetical protein
MDEYRNISRYEIENKLTGENFKINKIIGYALLTGPFIFLLFIIYLYQQNKGGTPEQQSVNLIELMRIIFFVLALSTYSLAAVLPKIFLRKEKIIKRLSGTSVQERYQNDAPIMKLIGVDRTLMIIRLSLMEGVTLFGFVILMLSVSNSVIYKYESYWLLIVPWILQLIFTINNYFNKGKVVERIYNEILSVVNS